MALKRCGRCGKKRDTKHFNKKCGDRLQSMCRDCQHKKFKKYYQENKAHHCSSVSQRKKELNAENQLRLLGYLRDHPCCDCGEKDPVVLEFDHVAGKKKDCVTRMLTQGYSWEALEKEIGKCLVRCANCHKRRHVLENGSYRTGP